MAASVASEAVVDSPLEIDLEILKRVSGNLSQHNCLNLEIDF